MERPNGLDRRHSAWEAAGPLLQPLVLVHRSPFPRPPSGPRERADINTTLSSDAGHSYVEADRFVGFANYTYNTARGGGFGATYNNHVVNVGLAYNNPLGIRGEAAASYTWAQTLDGGGCGNGPCDEAYRQSMVEVYWKILLTPNTWLTPGLQVVIDPALRTDVDLVWVPLIKFRVTF